jgi:hypothetical protein
MRCAAKHGLLHARAAAETEVVQAAVYQEVLRLLVTRYELSLAHVCDCAPVHYWSKCQTP